MCLCHRVDIWEGMESDDHLVVLVCIQERQAFLRGGDVPGGYRHPVTYAQFTGTNSGIRAWERRFWNRTMVDYEGQGKGLTWEVQEGGGISSSTLFHTAGLKERNC